VTLAHPAYETLREVTPYASVLLQRNPNFMTLDGTNTWVLRAPGASSSVVVDPGESDEEHLDHLLAAAPDAALVLVTHGHFDHSQLGPQLHARTGVPVRAADAQYCAGAAPLTDGEVLDAAGLRIGVLATPGHTADSVSFVVGDRDAVLTGDTILGRGTTVVAHPDGVLGPYLESLQRLRELGPARVLTGHGPELDSLADVASYYLTHRAQRLDQVRAALTRLGPDPSPREVVEIVYADVDEILWPAADLSVQAQLAYLRELPRPAG
jgi:glyoxylase-like metal-dependent hydrolase (beta-lactamase superfamily II)